MRARVPVLVVCGFLGSGKTTLVRRLLAHAQATGRRAAVISNEFGELGIDEALLGGGREEFVELAGGCVCCKLSDELVETLEGLRAQVDPDLILIETSGVALPFDTQLNLYRPPVNAWVGDEACVVVVSAAQMVEAGGAPEDETWSTQVSGADLLVLSKVDQVGSPAVDACVRTLAGVNPDAPVLPAVHGDVDPEVLFPRGPGEPRDRGGLARPHTHEGFESEEMRVPGGLDPAAAEAWIGARRGLRTKGFVATTAGVMVVQGVGRRLELTPAGTLDVPASLLNRVVVIRRGGSAHDHT
jgi:G3E family GTPase